MVLFVCTFWKVKHIMGFCCIVFCWHYLENTNFNHHCIWCFCLAEIE
jgi:hypothetical protein